MKILSHLRALRALRALRGKNHTYYETIKNDALVKVILTQRSPRTQGITLMFSTGNSLCLCVFVAKTGLFTKPLKIRVATLR